jgi:hypothetical protein
MSLPEKVTKQQKRELFEELGLPEGWKLQGRFEHLLRKIISARSIEQKHVVMLDMTV